MKKFFQIISIVLLSIILVETTGLNRIQHCCGSSEILLALSELDIFCSEKSCEVAYQTHHHCSNESEVPLEERGCQDQSDCCSHPEPKDYCNDHMAYGWHAHHHNGLCLDADFLQLRPEQKQDNYFHVLAAMMPMEIKVFDFIPQPVIVPMTDKYIFTIPNEAGRQKLALYSVFLI